MRQTMKRGRTTRMGHEPTIETFPSAQLSFSRHGDFVVEPEIENEQRGTCLNKNEVSKSDAELMDRDHFASGRMRVKPQYVIRNANRISSRVPEGEREQYLIVK
jgi:hypothetical protein